MTKHRRIALAAGTATLLALCLGCPGPPSPPSRQTCDEGAATASVTGVEVFGGWSVGIQGSDMISASVQLEGPDIPDCATISVSAVTVGEGREIWSETASMQMEERSTGWSTRGVLFMEMSPSVEDDCHIVLTATAYGQSTQIQSSGDSFSVCSGVPHPDDAGPEDAGPTDSDAGPVVFDGGSDGGAVDASTADASTADASTADASTADASTVEDSGLSDAGSDAG